MKQSEQIICPKCKEICIFNYDNYQINLNQCRNGHNIENILINEFNNSQKINEEAIKCNNCNKSKMEVYNSQFYICGNCNVNLCPICKANHSKEHIIIDYNLKNFLCLKHGERLISYCEDCRLNLCDLCEIDHDKQHKLIAFKEILIHEDIKNNSDELKL